MGPTDSNLQPDRYERSTLPGNSSKISVSRSLSFTFVRVCSRGFCRITGGVVDRRAPNRARPDGSAFRRSSRYRGKSRQAHSVKIASYPKPPPLTIGRCRSQTPGAAKHDTECARHATWRSCLTEKNLRPMGRRSKSITQGYIQPTLQLRLRLPPDTSSNTLQNRYRTRIRNNKHRWWTGRVGYRR